jgi:hypothetical protein
MCIAGPSLPQPCGALELWGWKTLCGVGRFASSHRPACLYGTCPQGHTSIDHQGLPVHDDCDPTGKRSCCLRTFASGRRFEIHDETRVARPPTPWRLTEPLGLLGRHVPTANAPGKIGLVLIARATRKLRQRLGSATPHDDEPSTTLLGEWYATLLPWRPQQLILLVNEHTLLPVLMPLAPSASVPSRIGPAIAANLAAHEAPAAVIERELSEMRDCRFGPTANRSVVGIMNEFSFLADVYRRNESGIDPVQLAKRLAATPCSPLYRRHTSPDRELEAFLLTA